MYRQLKKVVEDLIHLEALTYFAIATPTGSNQSAPTIVSGSWGLLHQNTSFVTSN